MFQWCTLGESQSGNYYTMEPIKSFSETTDQTITDIGVSGNTNSTEMSKHSYINDFDLCDSENVENYANQDAADKKISAILDSVSECDVLSKEKAVDTIYQNGKNRACDSTSIYCTDDMNEKLSLHATVSLPNLEEDGLNIDDQSTLPVISGPNAEAPSIHKGGKKSCNIHENGVKVDKDTDRKMDPNNVLEKENVLSKEQENVLSNLGTENIQKHAVFSNDASFREPSASSNRKTSRSTGKPNIKMNSNLSKMVRHLEGNLSLDVSKSPMEMEDKFLNNVSSLEKVKLKFENQAADEYHSQNERFESLVDNKSDNHTAVDSDLVKGVGITSFQRSSGKILGNYDKSSCAKKSFICSPQFRKNLDGLKIFYETIISEFEDDAIVYSDYKPHDNVKQNDHLHRKSIIDSSYQESTDIHEVAGEISDNLALGKTKSNSNNGEIQEEKKSMSNQRRDFNFN